MTKKPTKPTGAEIVSYLDRGALISVRDDGTRWGKSYLNPKWRLLGTKKASISFEDWKASKLAFADALPWWARGVKKLPSVRMIEAMASDMEPCSTVTGYEPVEPDGTGPDGAPSWLRALCLI